MRIRILSFLLFVCVLGFSQINDLAGLANGTFKQSLIVRDANHKVFGYLLLFERDKTRDQRKLEFIFLDKNLNKTINGEVVEPVFYHQNLIQRDSLSVDYEECNLAENQLVLKKKYLFTSETPNSITRTSPAITYQFLSLNENKVSKEYFFENDSLVEFHKTTEELIKKDNNNTLVSFLNLGNQFYKIRPVYEANCTGYVKISNTKFMFIDWDGKVISHFDKDTVKVDNAVNTYMIKQVVDSFLFVEKYLIKMSDPKLLSKKLSNFIIPTIPGDLNAPAKYLLAINLKTGKKLWETEIIAADSKVNYEYEVKFKNNKTYLIGNFFDPSQKQKSIVYSTSGDVAMPRNLDFTDLKLSNSQGLFVKEITRDGQISLDKSIRWTELSNVIAIDDKGMIDKNFKLISKEYFLFNNENISILTEKRNIKTNSETAGFVLLNFDKSFNISSVNQLVSEKTKNNISDYLFSQYFNSDNSIAFFNIVKTKDNSEYLGINMVTNGVLTEDRILMFSKKNYSIYPFPAKEGYVLLQEVNKKEKFNQIRLEKLNY